MTTIYEVGGFMKRQTIQAVVLVTVAIYGCWELWSARDGSDSTALLFGILFIGGAAYAYQQISNETRDQVARLEAGPDGRLVATLWRPTGSLVLTAENGLNNWRYHVKIGKRNAKRPYLYADHPDHPRPLQFELRADTELTDGLRALAPEAIDEYTAANGT